jgi:hypothetical protein
MVGWFGAVLVALAVMVVLWALLVVTPSTAPANTSTSTR